MSPNYQRIVDDVCRGSDRFTVGLYEDCSEVARRCEALANKRELTDEEIDSVVRETFGWDGSENYDFDSYKKLTKNLFAKQSEPEEIPFSQEKLDEGGWVVRLTPCDPVRAPVKQFEEVSKVTLVRKP